MLAGSDAAADAREELLLLLLLLLLQQPAAMAAVHQVHVAAVAVVVVAVAVALHPKTPSAVARAQPTAARQRVVQQLVLRGYRLPHMQRLQALL
jgi:hypothetical protein